MVTPKCYQKNGNIHIYIHMDHSQIKTPGRKSVGKQSRLNTSHQKICNDYRELYTPTKLF